MERLSGTSMAMKVCICNHIWRVTYVTVAMEFTIRMQPRCCDQIESGIVGLGRDVFTLMHVFASIMLASIIVILL